MPTITDAAPATVWTALSSDVRSELETALTNAAPPMAVRACRMTAATMALLIASMKNSYGEWVRAIAIPGSKSGDAGARRRPRCARRLLDRVGVLVASPEVPVHRVHQAGLVAGELQHAMAVPLEVRVGVELVLE